MPYYTDYQKFTPPQKKTLKKRNHSFESWWIITNFAQFQSVQTKVLVD